MKYMSTITKKIAFTLVLIGICSTFAVEKIQAQQSKIEIEVSSGPCTNTNSKDGSITVNVNSSTLVDSYILYDGEPSKGAKIVDKKKSSNNEHVFSKLKSGQYYVGVIDNAGNLKFKKILLEALNN